MSKRIEFEKIFEFSREIDALRQIFPELAREIDKCLFDVTTNHTPKCGYGTCSCQTMTFAKFHSERNRRFGTTGEPGG
jgi:hypothetical protein